MASARWSDINVSTRAQKHTKWRGRTFVEQPPPITIDDAMDMLLMNTRTISCNFSPVGRPTPPLTTLHSHPVCCCLCYIFPGTCWALRLSYNIPYSEFVCSFRYTRCPPTQIFRCLHFFFAATSCNWDCDIYILHTHTHSQPAFSHSFYFV